MKYSKIVKIESRQFRYDYDNGIVEMIVKADEEMLRDNIEWQEKFGRNLWEIDESGYYVEASSGLMRENWDDADSREEYLTEWIHEFDYEVENMVADYIAYEM